MMEQRISSTHNAFLVDALEESRPISVPVENPSEIGALFDTITYDKGAAVLRMLEDFLGAETFRRGLHVYLETK